MPFNSILVPASDAGWSPGCGENVKKADRLRAECRQRAEVAHANVGAAQQSISGMRAPPGVVASLLDTAEAALRLAIEKLGREARLTAAVQAIEDHRTAEDS